MSKAKAKRWRVLSGLNNWQNLLNPLDIDLQDYLLHYGSMAQACYDNFNSEKKSNYGGTSRYARKNLFSKVGLTKGNPFRYEAVKYIYATSAISVPESFILKPSSEEQPSWFEDSNWMAFIAVATDEGKFALGRRDILVAWRGTIQPIEWVKDFDFPLVPASAIVGKADNRARVHQGLLSIYTSYNPNSKFNKSSARDQVLSEVTRLLQLYIEEEVSITITGHSLGAALSILNAADIVCNGHNTIGNMTCPVTAFAFATMRSGDTHFRNILESKKDLHILSVLNAPDIVPHFPPVGGYTNIGIELHIDSRTSTYLKKPASPITAHNLEAGYLHTLSLVNGRDIKGRLALTNKTMDALKDDILIPTRWWVEKNKGMVQLDDGTWVLRDHEDEEEEDDPHSSVTESYG